MLVYLKTEDKNQRTEGRTVTARSLAYLRTGPPGVYAYLHRYGAPVPTYSFEVVKTTSY